ncbi:Cyclin-like F-box [Fusarium austroafricanum]|uniref:Cyclin-like F-box n=1 Tax=Fusarium austroafricanum TaxID=2364996 RepID=A0A8H4NUK8_9HYPO|nr:Cyclin-like F-box [Fusarium austroafricanum]
MTSNNTHDITHTSFLLLKLPLEIVAMIIEEVDDIETISSVHRSCKDLRSLCHSRNKRIIQNIFSSCYSLHGPEQRATKIYINLKLAVRCSFLSPQPIEDAFEQAWRFFREIHMEELLYPIAEALASRYCDEGLAAEGKAFLERIWNFQKPYEIDRARKLSPSLLPIARLLRLLAGRGPTYQLMQTRIYELEQFKKTQRPYFMLVRNNQMSWILWNECPLGELAALAQSLQDLQEELNYIRLLVATAFVRARKLNTRVNMLLDDLKDAEACSPEAPVTPTYPSVPWKDYTTDFEDDMDTIDSKEKIGD